MNNLYIMETEKYYGLNEPDKTTTIDSSNIDYNIPGQTTENPSLNTTNTSILYKASATSNYNYTKLSNCPQIFILDDHNDAITDSSLLVIEYGFDTGNGIEIMYEYRLEYNGIKKQVYLGYEDTNKIFTNKLSSIITTQETTLDSDTDGCSAKVYLIPNDNTGAPIKFSLNKCTADRIITFSYKNTPIFKIDQSYNKGIIYVFESFVLEDGTTFAYFNTNTPSSIPTDHPQANYIWSYSWLESVESSQVLMYTEYTDFNEDTPIGELLNTGKLTHLFGHDYLTYDKYKNFKLINFYNQSVDHFEDDVIKKDKITLNMNIYVYTKNDDIYQYQPECTFNFGNIESSKHLGVYRLTT